jgi:hypothetical protein
MITPISKLKVGEAVVVNTRLVRKGQTGMVHGFTAKKVRVLFSDNTTQAYFEGSLGKAQQTHQFTVHEKQKQVVKKQNPVCRCQTNRVACYGDVQDTRDTAILLERILVDLTHLLVREKQKANSIFFH